MEFIYLLVWVLCGLACYKMAERQGRNEFVAALLGLLFGVFAVIGYAIAGDKTPPVSGAH